MLNERFELFAFVGKNEYFYETAETYYKLVKECSVKFAVIYKSQNCDTLPVIYNYG